MGLHRNRSNRQTPRIQFVQWLRSIVFFLKRIVAKLAKWIWPLLKKMTYVLICYIAVPIANLAFMVVPFLHNLIPPVWAYGIWGSSLVIFAADSIYQWRKKQKQSEQSKPMDIFTRGFSWAGLVFFGSAFIVNYFETAYTWYWAIAVSIAVICPIAWMNMSTFISAQKQYTAEQRKRESWFSVKMTALYWLIDGFYISVFTKSLVWQFITGGLCMVIIYVNLGTVVLSSKKINKFGVIHDLIVGVALTVYLIYIIPDETLRVVVLAIVGALYGGIMTLVGVAWTIKDGQDREQETKRLDNLPFLQLEIPTEDAKPMFEIDLTLCFEEPADFIEKVVCLKNVGNGTATNIVYTWKYAKNNISDGSYLPINAIMKGDSYYIRVNCDMDESAEYETHAYLVLAYNDLLGHDYEQRIGVVFAQYDLVRFENDTPR